MTTEELVSKCKSAMEQGLNHVQLVLPRTATGGRRMVVFKKPRLYGEVCCENSDGHAVVFVDTIELLAWLAATGFVSVSLPVRKKDQGFRK